MNKTWKGSNDIFTEKLRFWRVTEKLGGCVIDNDQNGEFKMSETDMDNLWCQNISHHFCAK